MHVVLISQLDDMHAKSNKPTKSDCQASPKGGEIGIPTGKPHTPKIKKILSCYKNEKTMKSSLKSKESLNKLESNHRLFLAEDFCNLMPTKAQQNADFPKKKRIESSSMATAKREREMAKMNSAFLKKNIALSKMNLA